MVADAVAEVGTRFTLFFSRYHGHHNIWRLASDLSAPSIPGPCTLVFQMYSAADVVHTTVCLQLLRNIRECPFLQSGQEEHISSSYRLCSITSWAWGVERGVVSASVCSNRDRCSSSFEPIMNHHAFCQLDIWVRGDLC